MTDGERRLSIELVRALSGWMAIARMIAPVLDKKGCPELAAALRERIEMDRPPLEELAADPEYLQAIKDGAGM